MRESERMKNPAERYGYELTLTILVNLKSADLRQKPIP